MNTDPHFSILESEAAEGPSRPGTGAPASARRILAVDDDGSVRSIYALVLTDAGYRVAVVADGEQAWEALMGGHYDLLLTDNDMPRLSGLELTRRLRAQGSTLPVIIASGSFSQIGEHALADLRLAAILPKPFRFSELVQTVRRALPTLPVMSRADAAQADEHGLNHSKQNKKTSPGDTRLRPFHHGPNRKPIMQARIPLAPTLEGQPSALIPLPGRSRAGRHRVLIADDDALVRGSLAAVLESEGFHVDEAQDGVETVAQATAHAPDLVLLDLNMPKMDGWRAFAKLDEVRPLVPVIVITARPHQYQEAVRLGVDAFMEKPLDIPVLVNAVKQLTNEDEGRHTQRITKPDFVTRLLAATQPD